MIRFLLSLIIITLLITYAVIPFYSYIRSFIYKEKSRINDALKEEENEKKSS